MQCNSANQKNKLTHSTESIYFLYLGLLCMMFFLRDVMSMSIPLVVFIAYFTIGFLGFDYSHSLAITAMLPLLNHGIQTNYIVLIAIVIYFFKYGSGMSISFPLISVALLMVLEFFHVLYQGDSFAEYFRYVIQYAYVGLILGESRIRQLLKNPLIVIKTFIFMASYFMLDVLLVTLKHYTPSQMLESDFRFGSLTNVIGKNPALTDNQNMVAMFAVISIAMVILCIYREKKSYLLKSILIVYFTFFGLFTASRTFIVCLLFVALSALFFVGKKSIGKTVGIVLGVVLVVFILGNTVFSDLFEKVLERFNAEDITTGRGTLLALYNEFIFSDWKNTVFGIGLQNTLLKTGMNYVPHNGIQDTMLGWGVIGIVLIGSLVLHIIKSYRQIQSKKGKFVYFLPFLIYALFIQTIQFVRLSAIFGLLAVLYVCVLCGEKEVTCKLHKQKKK